MDQSKSFPGPRGAGNLFARPRDFRSFNTTSQVKINKRFSGGPGGRLFKKAPLVAEGKSNSSQKPASTNTSRRIPAFAS
jgi:hypothetical protein